MYQILYFFYWDFFVPIDSYGYNIREGYIILSTYNYISIYSVITVLACIGT